MANTDSRGMVLGSQALCPRYPQNERERFSRNRYNKPAPQPSTPRPLGGPFTPGGQPLTKGGDPKGEKR
jgi:hypothetical protein